MARAPAPSRARILHWRIRGCTATVARSNAYHRRALPSTKESPLRNLAFAIWAVGAALTLPASASAEIIGSDLSGNGMSTSCNVAAGCVVVQERIGGEYVEVIPPNAVITSWTTRGAEGRMALRAYRHRPDLRFTPGELHVTSVGQSVDQIGNRGVQTFPTRIPAKQGDYIALFVAGGGSHGFSQVPPPDTVAFKISPTQLESLNPVALELWLQARVEPDVDVDGLGDETQDPCVSCGAPAIKPPAPDPFAAIRRGGPKVSIAGRARVSRRGIAPVKLSNPYAFALSGRLTLTVGRKKVGMKKYSLPAKASKAVGVKLGRSTYRRLKRRGSLRALARATVNAAAGPTRRVKKKVKLLAPKKKKRRRD